MRQRAQAVSRFVEPDVTVRANPEDLQIDAAGRGDRIVVAAALLEQIGRRPVQKPDACRIDRHMLEQLGLHVGAIAVRIRGRQARELVEVECPHSRPADAIAAAPLPQLAIEPERGATRRQAKHQRRARDNGFEDLGGERRRQRIFVFETFDDHCLRTVV